MQTLANPDCISCSIKIPFLKNHDLVQVQPKSLKFSSKNQTLLKGVALNSVAAVDSRPFIVIDNYDSSYNLCQYVGELVHTSRCTGTMKSLGDLKRENFLTLLFNLPPQEKPKGPGPGTPQDSGISLATVLELGATIPIFGVCMGLQCIGEAFEGKVVRSPYGVMHGKSSPVYYDEKGSHGLLSGLPKGCSFTLKVFLPQKGWESSKISSI